ncbi:unnamed protein product [Phytomonas sp. Hart1]|nr:unnamed protein product [Phytomonas sp. Hart1]|eukprot:CCW67599.1 unnamed protein product [Phytomonas sp. isolate Hart1]
MELNSSDKEQEGERQSHKKIEITSEAEVSIPPPSRHYYLFLRILKRSPSYLFILIHICYIQELIKALYTNVLLPVAISEQHRPLLTMEALCNYTRELIPELLEEVLFPPKETRSSWSKYSFIWRWQQDPFSNVFLAKKILIRRLWRNPSTMLFLFGTVYISAILLIIILRLVYYSTRSAVRRIKVLLGRPTQTKATPGVYTMCRYGNGYDSILRLIFALVELIWFLRFIQYPRLSLGNESDQASAVTAASSLPLPIFNTFLPTPLQKEALVTGIEFVLALIALLDMQRIFHALFGVRPLFLANGWEGCPLCGESWRVSRRTANKLHMCSRIWLPPASTDSDIKGNISTLKKKSQSQTITRKGYEDANVVGSDNLVPFGGGSDTHHSPVRDVARPGDNFPDPNNISWFSFLTYNWLNPLLNVAVLSPFGTFGPPPTEAFTDGGRNLFQAQLAAVARLPRLLNKCRAQENGECAWRLWCSRWRTVADKETTLKEYNIVGSVFRYVTRPIRTGLMAVFRYFFIPPSASKLSKKSSKLCASINSRSATATSSRQTKKSIFELFLEHPNGREFVYKCIPLKFANDVIGGLIPYIVRELVLFLKEVSSLGSVSTSPRKGALQELFPDTREAHLSRGLFLCFLMFIMIFAQGFFFQTYLYYLYQSSVNVTSSLKMILLRRALRSRIAFARCKNMGEAETEETDEEEEGKDPLTASTDEAIMPQKNGRGAKKESETASTSNANFTLSGSKNQEEGKSGVQPVMDEGEVISLSTIDATNCGETLVFLHNVWGHPLIILVSLATMYSYVGCFPTVTTFAVLIAMIPLNQPTSVRIRQAQGPSRKNNRRINDLSSMLSSMRAFKAVALENVMWKRIKDARRCESDAIKTLQSAERMSTLQIELTTLIISLVCCGSYLLVGGKMDAAVLVPTMAVLNTMRFPLWTFPRLCSQVSRGYTSMKRIEHYMQSGTSSARQVQQDAFEDSLGSVSNFSNTVTNKMGLGNEEEKVSVTLPRGAVRCNQWSFAWSAKRRSNAMMAARGSYNLKLQAPTSNRSGNDKDLDQSLTCNSNKVSSSLLKGSPLSVSAASDSIVLHQVSIDITPGDFVVVQGPTGCGKSAFLLSILNELCPIVEQQCSTSNSNVWSPFSLFSPVKDFIIAKEADEGCQTQSCGSQLQCENSSTCPTMKQENFQQWCHQRQTHGFEVGGRVAYCAEIPWLRNQTLRENIRLLPDDAPETEEERQWYHRVLYACALTRDLKSMELGDRTVVGDGGSKLSGGQRARVALARAVFRLHIVDIFLLDDVLSALDVEVQKHIIGHVFHGLMSEESCEEVEVELSSQLYNMDSDNVNKEKRDSWEKEDIWTMPVIRPSNTTRRHKKTIILASHVPTTMLMPDRVVQIHSDGTVHELKDFQPYTQKQICSQLKKWENSTNETLHKDTQNTNPEEKNKLTQGEQTQDTEKTAFYINSTNSVSRNKILSNKCFTLFGDFESLKTLLVKYTGPRRLALVLFLSLTGQLFHTLLDNWLGIWLSLHSDDVDNSFRDKMVRFAGFPIRFFKGRHVPHSELLRPGSGGGLVRPWSTRLHQSSSLPYIEGLGLSFCNMVASRMFISLKCIWWWLYYYFVDSQNAVFLQFIASFAVIGILTALFSFLYMRVFFMTYQSISDTLQLRAVRRILRAPVSYFDRISVSGLLHVLSHDQEVVDHNLGESVQLIFFTILHFVSMFAFNTFQHNVFISVVPLSVLLFYHLTLRFFLLTKQVRSLEKKLHGNSVSILRESLKGAVTIRSLGQAYVTSIETEMTDALDAIHTANNVAYAADRWVGIRLEWVSIFMTMTIAVLAVCNSCFERYTSRDKMGLGKVSAASAYAGLGITSCMTSSRSLMLLCRRIGMFQNQYVSAEQLLRIECDTHEEVGCCDLEIDEINTSRGPDSMKEHTARSGSPTESGVSCSAASLEAEDCSNAKPLKVSVSDPKIGSQPTSVPLLEVRHLSAKYQTDLPWVLNDVSFTVHPNECVGLIGRTGNGKSSIFNALLQLMDVVCGEVLIQAPLQEKDNPNVWKAAQVSREGEAADKEFLCHGSAQERQQYSCQICNAFNMPPIYLRKSFFHLVSQEPLLIQGTCGTNLLLGLEEAVEGGDHQGTRAAAKGAEGMVQRDTTLTPQQHTALWNERLQDVIRKLSLDEIRVSSPTVPYLAVSPTQKHNEMDPTVSLRETPTRSSSSVLSILEHPITTGGTNLSAGQRQLLCLARALLHRPRIILLDEVSSRVDPRADALIQKVIKEEMLDRYDNEPTEGHCQQTSVSSKNDLKCESCGVLLIAHRLETIMSLCDRVLVIEKGTCVASLSIEEVKCLKDLESYL